MVDKESFVFVRRAPGSVRPWLWPVLSRRRQPWVRSAHGAADAAFRDTRAASSLTEARSYERPRLVFRRSDYTC